MSDKIQDIMKWYTNFEGTILHLQTNKRHIELDIFDHQLPHLLGLQYTQPSNERTGMKLYAYIYGKSDSEIFSLIEKNNPDKLPYVRARIETFEYFMKNLDKAFYVENTHKNSNIKSKHFLLETKEKLYMHLGLLSTPQGEIPESFDVINEDDLTKENVELETYIARYDDAYVKGTTIKEPVIKIERYEMKNDEIHLVPFSFDEEKNEALLKSFNALERDMDLDGVKDRYDADFRDNAVLEIGDLDKREKEKNKNAFQDFPKNITDKMDIFQKQKDLANKSDSKIANNLNDIRTDKER